MGTPVADLQPSLRAALYVRGLDAIEIAGHARRLRRVAADLGWNVTGVFTDQVVPGRKQVQLHRLLDGAIAGQVDAVLVPGLHHVGCSARQLVLHVAALARCGVEIVADDGSIDTTTAEGRVMLRGILAMAEADKHLQSERGRASIARARRRGSRIGRPNANVDVARAVALRESGHSYRDIARLMGIGLGTVHRAVRASEGRRGTEPGEGASEPAPGRQRPFANAVERECAGEQA